MEPIVLAVSGLSLLGVSSVLRRTADKEPAKMKKAHHAEQASAMKKKAPKPSLQTKPVLHPRVPILLSREASSVVDQ